MCVACRGSSCIPYINEHIKASLGIDVTLVDDAVALGAAIYGARMLEGCLIPTLDMGIYIPIVKGKTCHAIVPAGSSTLPCRTESTVFLVCGVACLTIHEGKSTLLCGNKELLKLNVEVRRGLHMEPNTKRTCTIVCDVSLDGIIIQVLDDTNQAIARVGKNFTFRVFLVQQTWI